MQTEGLIQTSGLSIRTVDSDSPVPLYYQIEEDLRRLIASGELASEATLPPEMELSRAYGVGRHTMRMALARLAADGLISRRAGRGTFVRPRPDRAKFYLDRSFTQQMADMGRTVRTEVLTCTAGVIDDASPDVFAGCRGAPCLTLARLRFGDDEPVGMQCSTILTERCPDLARQDFGRHGLYEILAREYQLAITAIRHAITATVADTFQAEALRIELGAPLLLVNTTTYLADHQLFEFTTSHYRADQYEFSTTQEYAA